MMLDTTVVLDLIRNPQGRAAAHLQRHGEEGVCLSMIVAAELRYGVAKTMSAHLTQRVDTLLSMIDVLAFDAPADRAYGSLRVALEAVGRSMGSTDLLIAAHASSMNVTLATGDVRAFRRVQGLKVENWLA